MKSALLCIFVLDLVTHAITGDVSEKALADAIQAHYTAHLAAYGQDLWTPKFHFVMHLPEDLRRFSFLIACCVHERKHRLAKRWAVTLDSKNGYENTLLEECTYSHLQAVEQP